MYKLFFADITGYFDKKAFKKGYNSVCDYRKKKIDKCQNENDKVRSLVAGLLFEEACAEYGVTNLLDTIKDGEQGKPYFDCDDEQFPGGSRVYFNISHSGNQVMVGMADTEIGVDIQEMKPLKADIASRFFTEAEQDMYFKASDEDCMKVLYKIWCLKESYVKFTGDGLREGLNTFSVLDHMMDSGIWNENYAYSVTTSDYKVEQGVANIETVKPKSKEEIATEILAKDEKRDKVAPAPEERTDKEIVMSVIKDDKTPRPVSEEELHEAVEEAKEKAKEAEATIKAEEVENSKENINEAATKEEAKKNEPELVLEYTVVAVPEKATFENKKKDYIERACGITKCKRFRQVTRYRIDK